MAIKFIVPSVLFLLCSTGAFTLDLVLGETDVLIAQSTESGYDLWIRQKPDIASVLLTESTRDPQGREANYALRNPVWHPANGDEKRILDGEFLDPAKKLYSLIDSTPEDHPEFGRAFHIFLPYIVVFGYDWARSGQIEIKDDTFINIRAFSLPYGDYSGQFRDNPFKLVFTQRPLDVPRDKAMLKDTEEAFKDIAARGRGKSRPSLGREDIIEQMDKIVQGEAGESLDLVLCLDTTASMEDDIEYVKQGLLRIVEKYRASYKNLRVGIVFYKDYYDEFLTKVFPFSVNYTLVARTISGASARGGRDTPEAVYEALHDAIKKFSWESQKRIIILIGDAPPHPFPRGKVTREMVFDDAASAGIELHTIILPQ